MLDTWELLQTTESKYRTLLEKIPAIVYVASFEEGSPVYVSPQIEAALGYPQQEWLSDPDLWLKLIHPEDRKRVEKIAAHMRATGAPFLAEYRMRSKDGRWLWFWDEGLVVRDGDDQPARVQGVMYDITQLVQTEQALRESEERYRMLVERSPDVIGIHQDGKLVFVNPAGADLLGVGSPERLIGRAYTDFILPEDLALIQERQDELDRKVPAPLNEVRIVRPDGEILYLESTALPITYQGKPGGLFISRDVTARKRAEEALRSAETRLHNVINSLPIVIIALDSRGVVTLSEGKGLQRIGIKPGEMVGRSACEYFGSLQLTLETDEAIPGDLAVQRVLAGETILGLCEFNGMYFKNQLTPMRDSKQQVVGAIVVVHDITVRVLVVHELEKSEARYRNLFEYSPVALWEEDFSAIKARLDKLRELGVADFRAFFEANPEELIDYIRQARVLDVNQAALALYGARSKSQLLEDLGRISDEKTLPAHQESILAIAAGKPEFEVVTVNRTLDGQLIDIHLRWSTAPGCEETYEKVLVSISDITERKRIERAEREQRALAEALRDTSSVLNSTLNQEEVLDRILDNIERVVDFDTAEILMIEDGTARIARCRGYEKMGIRPDEVQSMCFPLGDFPILRKIAGSHGALIVPDTDGMAGWVDVPRLRWIRSFAGAPIRIQDQVIGFLSITSAIPGFFDGEHGPRLQSLADQAAIALGNAQLYRQVVAGRERMRQLTQQVVSAQEQERRRLSRELHDEAGQSLTALKIGLQLVLADLPQELEAQRQQMQAAVALTEQTMEKMRLLAQDLRPPALDAIGLIPTLKDLCQNIAQRSGLPVEFSHKDVPDLPDATNVCLYRFLQEAMTNALKHAGPEHIWVRIWSNGEGVSLLVRDDGKGFDRHEALLFSEKGKGMGLLGMHERLELAGGKLEIETSPGQGTCLTARVPIDQAYLERRQSDDSRGGRG